MKMSFRGTPLFLMPRATAGSVPYLDRFISSARLGIVRFWKSLHSGSINMAVASFQSFVDSVFLSVFVLPCAEANGWDLSSGVELELCVCVGHVSYLGDWELLGYLGES